MRTYWWMFLWLVGCGMGPNSETLVDSLQVVSAINEPAEVAAMEPWELQLAVADPRSVGPQVMVWSCLDDTCETHDVPLEAGLGGVTLATTVPVPLYILACDPSVCDLAAPRLEDLQDPFGWLATLPIDGVSLAIQPVSLTDLPAEERRGNPIIEEAAAPEELDLATDVEPVSLNFVVPGASEAWGYSTLGGFGRPMWDVASDGSVALEWYAPEEGGQANVYVVFTDPQGGQALWTAEWTAPGT